MPAPVARARKFAAFALVSAPFALAACSQEKAVDVQHASPQQVAQQAATAAPHFTPGRWETTLTFEKLNLGGASQATNNAMAAAMQRGHVHVSCLTKERADKPDPGFFGSQDKDCTYDHFTLGGGKIDAKLVCSGDGPSRTMTMQGSYDATSMEMHATTDAQMPGGKAMSMAMTMRAHRTGECTGTEGKD